MIKILIQIKDNNIFFKTINRMSTERKNIYNTNIISDNELIFSDEYIYQNLSIVTNFIHQLIKSHNIDTAIIYNNKVVNEILDIIKKTPEITTLSLKDDLPINFKMCEKIVKTNIKSLSVNLMQDFMIEYLDKNKITVEIRNEILFNSNFMTINNFKKYSSIYYSKIINIKLPINPNEQDDIDAFFTINKYLKVIHIDKTIKSDLEYLIDIIDKHNKKDIKIVIHENINNVELIEYIKKVNKEYKKRIKISVSYSDSYLNKNFLPQANINILKFCIVLLLLLVIGSYSYVLITNYTSYQADQSIKEDLKELIEVTDNTEIIKELEKESPLEIKNDYIASIMTLNKEATGWIKINNTEIDYPVLQGNDNKYYLDHNIKNEENYAGWIYMDYRNDDLFRDDNTIIYGHTNYSSGIMFGTLDYVENEEWRSNPDNLIISIDSLYSSNKYQIFSYYNTHVTNDYLIPNFVDNLEKLEFFNLITDRSELDFNIELNSDDKIITLSTCDDETSKRFVVHAVLIN